MTCQHFASYVENIWFGKKKKSKFSGSFPICSPVASHSLKTFCINCVKTDFPRHLNGMEDSKEQHKTSQA